MRGWIFFGGGQGLEGPSLNPYRHSQAEQEGTCSQTNLSTTAWLCELVNATQFARSSPHDQVHIWVSCKGDFNAVIQAGFQPPASDAGTQP